jgi:hypothetical protein
MMSLTLSLLLVASAAAPTTEVVPPSEAPVESPPPAARDLVEAPVAAIRAPPTKPRPPRLWRLAVELTSDHMPDDGSRWAGLEGSSSGVLAVSRQVGAILAITGGVSYRGPGDQQLSVEIFEGRLGVDLAWPGDGLFGFIRPYVGAVVLFGWAHAAAVDLADDAFTPGLEVSAGGRAYLGRGLFLFTHATYAWRKPTTFALGAQEEGGIRTVETSLGELDMSTYGWSFGAGLAL